MLKYFRGLKYLGRALASHLTTINVRGAAESVDMGLWFDRSNGELTIQPTDFGLWLMGAWSEFVATPIMLVRQHHCSHPRWVCEGYGGPDSGADGGHCPDCGYSFFIRMY